MTTTTNWTRVIRDEINELRFESVGTLDSAYEYRVKKFLLHRLNRRYINRRWCIDLSIVERACQVARRKIFNTS